jgi:selenocysteine lyase/cysteine desulfurase
MDPIELRENIPALEQTTYLNTGASGPSPKQVVNAACDTLRHHEFEAPASEGMYGAAFDMFANTRAAVADHLGAKPEEIALTESTGDGIARLAAAIDWQPGDVVVRTDLEHHASVIPWARLERILDVDVRVIETMDGDVDQERFAEAVADARLVALSSVGWKRGTRLAIEELTSIAQDAGTRVLIDAVQSIGQHSVDVTNWDADVVVASGHKWLLGEWGSGFMYVDRAFAEQLHPSQLGYFGVEYPPTEDYDLKSGAQRFEVGTVSLAPYAALQEAITIIEALGYDSIEARIERLTDQLKSGLDNEQLLSSRAYESGLVAFRVDDPESAVQRLKEQDICVKAICDLSAVRASVHVYNTSDDIERLLDGL